MTASLAPIEAILADPMARAAGASRAIGYVGPGIPDDLLSAPGMTALHLPWQPDRPTPLADGWLESSFPIWARSMVEDWAQGCFDGLEAVVFSRGDDAAQRLYYYVSELQRCGRLGGPRALIFDLAAIRRASSEAHTIAAVRRLANILELSEDDLREGILIANRRRRSLAAIDAERTGDGVLHEKIARASLFAPLVDQDYRPPQGEGDFQGRAILAGTPPPDHRLHRLIGASGWAVVGEAHERSLDRLGPEIDAAADPVAAVGRQIHAHAPGSRAFCDRAGQLAELAGARRADAVILWLAEEDEALVWEAPRARDRLAAAHIPCLFLARRDWRCRDDTNERIAGFLATIEPAAAGAAA